MLVYIEGKPSTRSWEGKNGEKRQATEVVTDTVKMLGGKKPKKNQQAAQPNGAPPGGEEDIPF
jgi:single-strand DNA-binding protein